MIRHSQMESEDGLQSALPDLTTLLDIMFILLVFFILTAGVSYRALDLTLPSSVEEEISQTKASNHIMLELRDTTYAIDGTEYLTAEDVKSAVIKAIKTTPDKELVIAGDRSVSLERLLGILTFLEKNGIDAANILMQGKKTP